MSAAAAPTVEAGAAKPAKKGKKKRANAITISKIAPTPIPAGDGINALAGVAAVPLTVGKKAKGKENPCPPGSFVPNKVHSFSWFHGEIHPCYRLQGKALRKVAKNSRSGFISQAEAISRRF